MALSVAPAVAAQAAAAPTVTLTATPAVEVGQPVAVALNAAGASDVFSYAITFDYDPAIFDYVADSASEGPAGGFSTVVEGPGTVTLVYTRLGTSPALAVPPAGSIDLPATLTFTTVGTGTSSITASIAIVGTGGVAATPTAAVPTPAITVAPVPVVVPPDPDPTDAPDPDPTDAPTPDPTSTETPTPTASPTAGPSVTAATPTTPTDASSSGDLAFTGIDGGLLLALALAGVAAIVGGVLVVRRRTASVR